MTAAPPLIDPHVFDELQANVGADFVVELIETFAAEAPALIADLRHAQQAQDGARFRRCAHALKSNGNAFGATRLGTLARALEHGGLPADAAPIDTLAHAFEATLADLRERARG